MGSRQTSLITKDSQVQLDSKMAVPVMRCLLVGCFNLDFKCSYTLDYIAALIRSPIYALHGLALRAIQCKVLLFVFELVC